jgi:uncharacterized NAD-dependent epimerase/dehydratase family protein
VNAVATLLSSADVNAVATLLSSADVDAVATLLRSVDENAVRRCCARLTRTRFAAAVALG